MPPTPKQGEYQLLLEPSQQMGRFQGNAGETGEVLQTPEGCRMGGHGGPEASLPGAYGDSFSKKSHCVHPWLWQLGGSKEGRQVSESQIWSLPPGRSYWDRH